MIEHLDPEPMPGPNKLPGLQNILLSGFGVAARMIMSENDRCFNSPMATLKVCQGWTIDAVRLPIEIISY